MDTVLISLFVIMILLFSVLTLTESYVRVQDNLAVSWKQMEKRAGEQARTHLTVVRADSLSAGAALDITLRNSGSVKLTDFAEWDVIIQHYDLTGDYLIDWYDYRESGLTLGGEWTVGGIYVVAATEASEVFDPGILNPGEEIVIRTQLSSPMNTDSVGVATVSTWNGITASAVFTR